MLINDIVCDAFVIGGDFNIVQNAVLDKIGGNTPKGKSKQTLMSIKSQLNIHDIWRSRNPSTKAYTWYQKNPDIRCRLDYFLISKSLLNSVKDANIYQATKTDHKAISVTFDFDTSPRGPGFWKLNNSLLSDSDYKNTISDLLIQKWEEHSSVTDVRVRWDLLKFEVQSKTLSFAKEKAKQRRNRETNILNELEKIDTKIISQTASDTELSAYEALKNEYDEIQEYKAKGSQIRSRIQHIEKNEKKFKVFFNQSKLAFERKSISKLKKTDGIVITNRKEILDEMQSFYSDLYTSCNPNLNDPNFNTIRELNLPTLNAQDKTQLESDITLDECINALNAMPENKSPGHDGFGVEFYKVFWDTIGTMFLQTLQYSLKEGELTQSQRRAVITLIQKKGKDETLIKNWRPISLLNCDYKIFSKVLSLRIKQYLPKLIHTDQVGCVLNRFIDENKIFFEDLVEHIDSMNENVYLYTFEYRN